MLFRHRKPALGFRCVLLSLFSLGLMIFDYHTDYLQPIQRSFTTLIAPLQYVVTWPVEIVEWVKVSFVTHSRLVAQNTQLQAEQLVLRGQIQRLVNLEEENNQLRHLLNTSSHLSESMRAARLLAVSMEPFTAEVILDGGTQHKILVGQSVMDGYGILGQVIQVGALTSRVMLINDPRSGVPVQNERNGVRGILQGQGTYRPLALINIPTTEDIQAGDLLTSSGLGLRYPSGYPVGRVISVTHVPGERFTVIEVAPSAHLFKSRQVLLVDADKSGLTQAKKREINL